MSRLLVSAVLATQGDILELGSGHYSTPVLHRVVEDRYNGARMVVTADTDAGWLPLFGHLASPFHQFVLVPVFSDGGHCSGEEKGVVGRPSRDRLGFAGMVDDSIVKFDNIQCPNVMESEGN